MINWIKLLLTNKRQIHCLLSSGEDQDCHITSTRFLSFLPLSLSPPASLSVMTYATYIFVHSSPSLKAQKSATKSILQPPIILTLFALLGPIRFQFLITRWDGRQCSGLSLRMRPPPVLMVIAAGNVCWERNWILMQIDFYCKVSSNEGKRWRQ